MFSSQKRRKMRQICFARQKQSFFTFQVPLGLFLVVSAFQNKQILVATLTVIFQLLSPSYSLSLTHTHTHTQIHKAHKHAPTQTLSHSLSRTLSLSLSLSLSSCPFALFFFRSHNLSFSFIVSLFLKKCAYF